MCSSLNFPVTSVFAAALLVIASVLVLTYLLDPPADRVKPHVDHEMSKGSDEARWVGLTEPSPSKAGFHRSLPVTHKGEVNDAPEAETLDAGPAIALIIDDLGLNATQVRAAMQLPRQVTFSFLPYGARAPALAAEAKAAGHEIMLHMPMEPLGMHNPGPGALRVDLSAGDLALRTRLAVGRFEGLVGVNNHMGSRVTQNRAAMREFLAVIAECDLIFVDSRTSGKSVAGSAARALALTTADRDIFLDHGGGSVASVSDALREAERLAFERGVALGIGHPRPATFSAIKDWWSDARPRGARLVSLSEYVQLNERAERPQMALASKDADY